MRDGKRKRVEELEREGVWGEEHDAKWRMNTVVLRGWHGAIHSAPVPKRACRQGGITEERGGETDNKRKERHHPAANSPNEMFPSIGFKSWSSLKIHPPARQHGNCVSMQCLIQCIAIN